MTLDMNKINVYIGYDQRESIAFSVLSYSILKHASLPVNIIPINLYNLRKFYKRKKGPKDSTDFSISRFLTPYLSAFKGYSIFMDCDFIINGDIAEVINIAKKDSSKAVWCVKHSYVPKNKRKFLNERQLAYNKKNWSSFMVFNNKKCKKLTLKLVEKSNGLFLHQFKWLKSDKLIGSLPAKWNVLVGEQKIPKNFKALHYTIGGPYFKIFKKCKGSNIWFNCKNEMMRPL